MAAKIPVMLKDGTVGRIYPSVLDRLLEADRVKLFRRENGWVLVGDEPIRGTGSGAYKGPERRSFLKRRVQH